MLVSDWRSPRSCLVTGRAIRVLVSWWRESAPPVNRGARAPRRKSRRRAVAKPPQASAHNTAIPTVTTTGDFVDFCALAVAHNLGREPLCSPFGREPPRAQIASDGADSLVASTGSLKK